MATNKTHEPEKTPEVEADTREYVKATPETIGLLEFGVADALPSQTKNRARTNPFDDAVMKSYTENVPLYAWVLDVESASRAIRGAAAHHKIGVQVRPGTKETDHTVHDGKQYHCVYFQGKDKRGYTSGDEELAETG